MEAAEYSDEKAEREQRIASLQAERATLQSEVAAMKEKVAQLEFERSERALQGEIEALRTERTTLEEKAHAFETEAQDISRDKLAPATIRVGPAASGNTAQIPAGQGRVEQVRPSPIQRPSLAPGTPRAAGPSQSQPKPKVNQ